MEYPEEIYQVFSDDMSGSGRRHAYEVGRNIGYLKGLAERPDPLTGYSNLTVAIKDNEPIDWEKLDGLKVQCVNPNIGTNMGTMRRGAAVPAEFMGAWWDSTMDDAYIEALRAGWNDRRGWTLWIEGEVPLRRKTADQLPDYTYFLGKSGDGKTYLLYTGRPLRSGTIRNIYYAPEMMRSFTPASEWMVLEEYGPFQKPDVK